MDLLTAELFLRRANVDWNTRDAAPLLEALSQIKREAVAVDDQATAKIVWCLEKAIQIQNQFIEAYRHLKAGEGYDAWCLFEQVEVALHHLSPHRTDCADTFFLDFIAAHTAKFQKLFPYALFFSPALLISKKTCSVCGTEVRLRSGCAHRKGDIYDGEMCCHAIVDAKILEISVVTSPKQKYSVALSRDQHGNRIDHHNYTVVRYVADGLGSPFDGWDVKLTTQLQSHQKYQDVGRNGLCPCGSKLKYKHCCLNSPGVARPHYEVRFWRQPPNDLPQFVQISREKHSHAGLSRSGG